jgi:hypothetical protein
LWISGSWGDEGCWLLADAEGEVTIDANGHLAGVLEIPAQGFCHVSEDTDPHPILPGAWDIVLNCTACAIGEIEVTDG